MRTAADQARDNARSHLDKAAQELAKVVIEQVHGTEDYGRETRDGLRHTLLRITQARDDL